MVIPEGPIVLVPSLAIECAPELGAWGFVAGFGADLPIFEHVGVDPLLTLAHDQPGMDWGKATLSFGVGAGFSVFFGQWSVSVAL